MGVVSTFDAAMAASGLGGSRKGEAISIFIGLEEAAEHADPAVLRSFTLVDFATFFYRKPNYNYFNIKTLFNSTHLISKNYISISIP